MRDDENFLRRWSRRKHESALAGVPEGGQAETKAPLQLPSVDDLAFESDFKDFMRPEVDRETRNAALKKLFMSPHYRATDGLDVYIGDYSSPDPLPAAMLAGLVHARGLLAADRSEAPPDSGMVRDAGPQPEVAKVEGTDAESIEPATGRADADAGPADQS